jgi:hypothetical protein
VPCSSDYGDDDLSARSRRARAAREREARNPQPDLLDDTDEGYEEREFSVEDFVEYLAEAAEADQIDNLLPIAMDTWPLLQEMRDDLNNMVPMLCAVCRKLDTANIKIPSIASKWWERHKAEDAERLRARKAELLAIRAKADEELEAIGELPPEPEPEKPPKRPLRIRRTR